MIKKLIGVLAYATTSSAISAELFNDGTNSLTIGGFVDFALYSEELRTIGGQVVRDGQRTDIGGSRIHFDFRHQATEALELQLPKPSLAPIACMTTQALPGEPQKRPRLQPST